MAEFILDRLARHAAADGSRPAYTFLRESGPADALTFGQLAARVWGLAAHLRDRAPAGERALLLLPNGLDFVVGFLASMAAGLVAVPAYPPRRNRKAERLQAIVADCTPRVVLTTADLAALDEVTGLAAGGAGVVAADRDWAPAPPPAALPANPNTVAYLQYTSGSTGTPKGVVITFGALAANQVQIDRAFGSEGTAPPRVSWLPMFHDMGLVGGVLQPLHTGGHGVLMAPETFLREPARWLRAVSDYRAVHTGGPNFALDHAARTVTPDQKRGLDLSSLEVLYCGAEPIRPETFDRFAAAFAPCGFDPKALFPCYGLAEATLFVSGGPAGRGVQRLWVDGRALEAGRVDPADPVAAEARCLVGNGHAADRAAVVAVDPRTGAAVPPGRVGEIWVKSPALGRGYWGRGEDGGGTFVTLAGGDGPYLRTGDLGFVRGGQVFVTGRLKDVIIVRGRNVYPQDVEAAVAAALPFPAGNGVAAFAVEAGGEERVGVVVEADREFVRAARAGAAADGLVAAVRRAVTGAFEVPVHAVVVVRPGAFPRTSSGKVQRQECRARFRDGTLDPLHVWTAAPAAEPAAPAQPGRPEPAAVPDALTVTPPPGVLMTPPPAAGRPPASIKDTEVSFKVTRFVRQTLQLPPEEELDRDAPLAEWGLESLSAFDLRAKVEQEWGVSLPAAALPDAWTIKGLRDVVHELKAAGRPAGGAVEWLSATDLAAAPGLLGQMRGMIGRAFDQPAAVLDRVLGGNDGAYLGFDETGRVHSFLFCRTGTVTVDGRAERYLCVGLNCSRADVVGSGATLPLYARCLADAAGDRPLLVCGTTMNPSVLLTAEKALGDFAPAAGRAPSAAALAVTRGLRAKFGYGAPTDPDPHVVRDAFRPFSYTPAERARLLGLIARAGHPLLKGLRPERCDGVLFHGWLAPRPAAAPAPWTRRSGVVSLAARR